MKNAKNITSLSKIKQEKLVGSLIIFASAALLALFTFCPILYAEEAVDVMRVEQDWEVVLNEPGTDIDAPQFHTVISPFGNLDSFYLQVCWNYREEPDFVPGGMQLQAWQGEDPAGKKSYREDKLSTFAETITWTQTMQTNGSVLTLGIINGSSTTWGSFGGADTSLSGNVGVANLNGYSTDTSVYNSWISYGANRVNTLRITEVRRYDRDGKLISRDQTPRVVFQLVQ